MILKNNSFDLQSLAIICRHARALRFPLHASNEARFQSGPVARGQPGRDAVRSLPIGFSSN